MGIDTETYIRKPLYVEAVRVTEENFDEIRAWVSGKIEKDGPKRFIRVFVKDPKVPRQSKAFVGDWILWTERGGHKVYTPKAFERDFDKVEPTLPAAAPVIEATPGVTIEAAATEVTTVAPNEDDSAKIQVDEGIQIEDTPTAPPPPPEGKTVLTLDQQRIMSSDDIMEALRSGDVVLEQDLAA
jgi:hypothetical protein